jgi:hypothetical protein
MIKYFPRRKRKINICNSKKLKKNNIVKLNLVVKNLSRCGKNVQNLETTD